MDVLAILIVVNIGAMILLGLETLNEIRRLS